ncbi:MAG: DUF438 domain-containing protein [Spirochaetes bacterium]|nr:DUF438 domain-containing protein [Spirochaetota bacterium]
MSEFFADMTEKKEMLKKMIKMLHDGADVAEVKSLFKREFGNVMPHQITMIEEELIKEGMPAEEVHRLCQLHIELFKESIDAGRVSVPQEHPLHILYSEHEKLLDFAQQLAEIFATLTNKFDSALFEKIENLIEFVKESSVHYAREENVLFPILEKYGVTQPPKIMWMEHDAIRAIEKELYTAANALKKNVTSEFLQALRSQSIKLSDTLADHFYKENNILFPTSHKLFSDDDWKLVKQEFDEIGYMSYSPVTEKMKSGAHTRVTAGVIEFETGKLNIEQLEAMLNTLPVDFTFIDKDDVVCYFNNAPERIFVRSKAVIGRTVQNCHPQKSIDVVNRLLEEMKSGKRNKAEFWIELSGKLVYITYYAVRNRQGEYLGCLEVTQDITNIKKIEGQKRLLD